jgi:hypothetical protein
MHLHVLSRRDVPDEICDGFLQFKESVRTVFANCAFHCTPQIIIRGCKIGPPWWPMFFEIILSLNTSLSSVLEKRAVLLKAAAGNFILILVSNEWVNHFTLTF